MLERLRWLNPALQRFGRKIVPSYLGHWYVDNHVLRRRLIPMGYRIARRGEWEGLPDCVSELDRFAHKVAGVE